MEIYKLNALNGFRTALYDLKEQIKWVDEEVFLGEKYSFELVFKNGRAIKISLVKNSKQVILKFREGNVSDGCLIEIVRFYESLKREVKQNFEVLKLVFENCKDIENALVLQKDGFRNYFSREVTYDFRLSLSQIDEYKKVEVYWENLIKQIEGSSIISLMKTDDKNQSSDFVVLLFKGREYKISVSESAFYICRRDLGDSRKLSPDQLSDIGGVLSLMNDENAIDDLIKGTELEEIRKVIIGLVTNPRDNKFKVSDEVISAFSNEIESDMDVVHICKVEINNGIKPNKVYKHTINRREITFMQFELKYGLVIAIVCKKATFDNEVLSVKVGKEAMEKQIKDMVISIW